MSKTILITGASSGIGKASAILFAAKGWNVICSMRTLDREKGLGDQENVLVTRLDVRDHESIKQTISAGITKFGKIDALVNNAGYSLFGVFETIPPEKIQEQFAVNVLGVMDVTRAVLPHFRKNKGGLIINISSRAGLVGMPLISLYCATKHALEGFSESLAYELASQNIGVKLVEPSGGVTNTNFVERLSKEQTPDVPPDYETFVSNTRAVYSGMQGARKTSAEAVAEVIFEAATDGTRRLRYFTGEDSGDFAKAKREMPEPDYLDFMRAKFLPTGPGSTERSTT
jgi:NAD(P)-dependent dehydrogenase (short-subunit alcohol dehydrogenase family)